MAGFLSSVKEWFSGAPSAEEQTLIDAVAADRDNDQPRLAYADWLSAKGNPRGDFIRAEVTLAGMDETDERRSDVEFTRESLIDKHGKKWVKPLKELNLEPNLGGWILPGLWFNRGMIENITVDKRGAIPGKAERLWQLAPTLCRLSFERCSPDWEGVAACPEMRNVIDLDLSPDIKIDPSDLQDLLGSPHLANLQVLDLSSKRFGGRVVDALTGSSITGLKTLTLKSCELDDAAIAKLLAWPGLASVVKLSLGNNELSPVSMQAIATSRRLQHVEAVNLENNHLAAAGAVALAAAQLPKLKDLSVESNEIDADGLAALAKATFCGQLQRLNLNYNRIGDDGLKRLAQSNLLTGVTHLGLRHNNATFDGIRAVLNSPHLGNLIELDVSHAKIGAAGAEFLIACEKLAKVRKLRCNGIECGDEWEAKLKEKFGEDMVDM